MKIICTDAFQYAESMGAEHYDCAYVDIWHDVLDGVNMYLRMKRLENHSPGTKFLYWIEPSMLAWLRGKALMEAGEGIQGPMMTAIGGYTDADDLRRKVSDDNLRRLAPIIPLEVTKR